MLTPGGPIFFPLPAPELPEFVSNVAMAIIEHGGMKSKMSVDSWDASNELIKSKYAESLVQLPGKPISQDATTWACEMSGEAVMLRERGEMCREMCWEMCREMCWEMFREMCREMC